MTVRQSNQTVSQTVRGALTVGILVVSFLVPLGGAWAQASDMTPLLNRLDRLERDISTLGRELARQGEDGVAPRAATSRGGDDVGTVAPGSEAAVARIGVRISAIDEEVRALTGRVESLTFRMDEIMRRLDKLVGDVDYRLSRLEQGGSTLPKVNAAPSPAGVQAVPPGTTAPKTFGTITQKQLESVTGANESESFAPASDGAGDASGADIARASEGVETAALPTPAEAILPEGSVKDRYLFAFNLLRKARYGEAEEALRAFLREHGDDALASNARYWLGETFYVRGDFVGAAKTFAEAYRADPTGAKAPDTLLKLGMSMMGLDKKAEACATYGKLEADFPDLSPNLAKTLAREKTRSGC